MKIAFIGQQAFGENVLNALTRRGHDVVAVFCPPDKPGKPHDPVKTTAETLGVPLHQFPRLRDSSAIETFASVGAELCVMAFVTDIVPMEIIAGPSKGTIQYHPSLLPKHRGPSSINWPIIKGETKTGLSIFWPDAGLDTGPILLREEIEISPDDTLGTVYFQKLFPMGVNAMVSAVEMVRDGTAPRIAQDESLATYEGWVREKESSIDWSQSLETVHNLVRGCDPNPGAHSLFRGEPIHLYGVTRESAPGGGRAGEIVAIADDGVRVRVGDGGLGVTRVRQRTGGKMSAAEWAAAGRVKAGERFGE